MTHRQTDLFTDGAVDAAINRFLEILEGEGLTDHQIQVTVAKMHYENVAKQIRKFPKNIRDRWVLWLVEEFLEE